MLRGRVLPPQLRDADDPSMPSGSVWLEDRTPEYNHAHLTVLGQLASYLLTIPGTCLRTD